MSGFRGETSGSHIILLQGNDRKFKSVQDTYKIFTFVLTVSMMYPNPKTDKIRQVGVVLIALCCIPIFTILFNDIVIRIQNKDMENLIRQIIVTVCLIFHIVKSFLTIICKKELQEIFTTITEDYAIYNNMSEEYQEVVAESVKKSKFVQVVWTSLIGLSAIVFPGTAIVLNIYTALFTDSPKRFMVHECFVWDLTPEQVYSTPVYEIFFLYSLFIVLLIFVGYTGFDGMFSVCVFHVSLKMNILSKKLLHLLDDKSDLAKIKASIAEIVKSQREIYALKDKIMKCYEFWLAMIFIVSLFQSSMTLSQIATNMQVGGANIIFLMFLASCLVHIYLPCYLVSDVTHTASLFADAVYDCSWEDFPDSGVRRSVCFMIARAQIPMDFKALKLLTFNMTMFVSVVQTAYSMFTILRQ